MLALPRLALLFVACSGETQAHISPGQHDGARRRLGWYKFKCDLKNEYALRIGVIGDADYVGRLNGEEGFKSAIQKMVKGASRAFENNLGFTLDIAHVILPSDFQHLPNSFLHASCMERHTENRLRDFNHFRVKHLSDKPAALWILWTVCISDPGAASFVGNLCTTTSPVAVMSSVSDVLVRMLVHEIGHAIGAIHPQSKDVVGDVMGVGRWGSADYTIEGIRFLNLHESNLCDVIDHSLGRKTTSTSTIFGHLRNNVEMNKDLCWKRVAGDNDVGGDSQKSLDFELLVSGGSEYAEAFTSCSFTKAGSFSCPSIKNITLGKLASWITQDPNELNTFYAAIERSDGDVQKWTRALNGTGWTMTGENTDGCKECSPVHTVVVDGLVVVSWLKWQKVGAVTIHDKNTLEDKYTITLGTGGSHGAFVHKGFIYFAMFQSQKNITDSSKGCVNTTGNAWPRHIAFSDDDKAYVACEHGGVGNNLYVYDVESSSGNLVNENSYCLSSETERAGNTCGKTATNEIDHLGEIRVYEDYLYVSNRVVDKTNSDKSLRGNAIYVLKRDAIDKEAKKLPLLNGKEGINAPKYVRSMDVSPNGHFLVAAGQYDNRIVIWELDSSSGKIQNVMGTQLGSRSGTAFFVGFIKAEAPTTTSVRPTTRRPTRRPATQAPTTTSVRPTPTRPTRRPATQDCTDVWAEKCRWRKWDCSRVKNVQENCRRTCGLCGDSATQRSAKNQEGDSGGIDVVAIVAGVCAGTVVLGLVGALFCAFVRTKTGEMPRE